MASKNETKAYDGIVLRTIDYKETDLLVDILTDEGKKCFLARGAKKLTSKNAPSLRLLTKGTFVIATNLSGKGTLKESAPIRAMNPKEDLPSLFALNFVAEATNAFSQYETESERKVYRFLDATLSKINDGYDPLSASLIYLSYILKTNGSGLDVSECVRCHSKRNIVGVSYQEGGFLCKTHIAEGDALLSPYALKVIRYCFMVEADTLKDVVFEKKTTIHLLKDLAEFSKDQFGIKLKSVELLKVL